MTFNESVILTLMSALTDAVATLTTSVNNAKTLVEQKDAQIADLTNQLSVASGDAEAQQILDQVAVLDALQPQPVPSA